MASRRTASFVISALAVAAVTAVDGRQQPPVFSVTGESVPVFVTVTDTSNRLVTTLTRDDFQVLDNGRPQRIALFDNSPQPVRLVVMIDVSGSMYGNLPLLRAASDALFQRLRPDDRARVGVFGREVAISPTFTNDIAALRSALPNDIDPAAPTPLWKGVDDAMTAFGDEPGRHVVLVLSDGKDTGLATWSLRQKRVGQLDVVDRAIRDDVMIYGVGLYSRGASRGMPPAGADLAAWMSADFPDPGLGTAAIDSGGGYFEIRPRDDLAAAFARVADELHSQYLMGFAPPARDGKLHKIEVKVTPRDLKPRARKSYRAPK